MKRILLLILLITSIQPVTANTDIYHKDIEMSCSQISGYAELLNMHFDSYVYYSWFLSYTFHGTDCTQCYDSYYKRSFVATYIQGDGYVYKSYSPSYGHDKSGSASGSGEKNGLYGTIGFHHSLPEGGSRYCLADGIATLVVSSEPPNEVYGNTGCINLTELYIKKDDEWYLCNSTTCDSYSFPIYNGSDYLLLFDDIYGYEFTCSGSDIEYDYSVCTYIYGYTCNINWVKLWRNDAGSWMYVDMESQPNHGLNTYVLQIESGYDYKVNFSDGHEHEFTCSGSDIEYDWDRCVWAYPPSPWQPPEIIPWYLGYDNNIVFMRDSHGNFIENAQIAVYNKNTGNYTQKWTNTPDPYILLAANNDSNDDVIVMCRTFDGVFTLETVDPAFGTDENVTWTNWTIPIMYNLEIHPIDQSNMPLHHVFVSMYEYTPFDPLAFFGYDTYWGCVPVTNCSGFSRCDIVAEKEGYRDYNVTGLNWTTKSALAKDYKQDIVLVRES